MSTASPTYPVRLEGHLDPKLSRWLWLVKWLLLIPHFLALLVLWTGLLILTVIAYLAVLFTGRYPRAIRAYNLGVLRWTWRVNYYGYEALGTDRYPPFTLADVPDYPARLHLDETPAPARWLPLVAWLFAIPHVLLVGALTGAATWEFHTGTGTTTTIPLGVVSVGLTVVALSLLFTGRYPRGLYDLLLGVSRWSLRVVAYLALLTPRYPPFRLDQGEREPDDMPTGPPDVPMPPPGVAGPSTGGTTGPRGSAAGAVSALVVGAVLFLPATGLGLAGGALLALDGARDSSGYVTSPLVSMHSDTAAITAEGITIEGGDLWTRNVDDVGGVTITASGTAGTPLFVGIARTSAVTAWLGGVTHDRLTGVSAGSARYDRTGGSTRGVDPPVSQDFWLASATGTGRTTLAWQASNGDFTVVLANADGSAGVTADVRAAAQVPDLSALGAGLLLAGMLAGILGITLVVVGAVGLGRRHDGPAGPGTGAGAATPLVSPTTPPVPVS